MPVPTLYCLSRVILLIGLGLGNKKAPGRGAFLLSILLKETKPLAFNAQKIPLIQTFGLS